MPLPNPFLRTPEPHPLSSCHHCFCQYCAWSSKYPRNVPKLEVLAALQCELRLGLALDALQSQDNLLGGLGLLVEDRLGLTTVTGLLAVVTALTLGVEGSLAGLVLSDLVLGVLAALLALAVGVAGFRDVDLDC